MRDFLSGGLFGLLFSALALWLIKFSKWAFLPEVSAMVFILGGALLGGLIHLLLGGKSHVTAD
ncbi:MAG: hypothetical protein ACREP8_00265 [Candidatus Binatia bacterium]